MISKDIIPGITLMMIPGIITLPGIMMLTIHTTSYIVIVITRTIITI
jgi:hypothetical protein